MAPEPRKPFQFGLVRLFNATFAVAVITWVITYHPFIALVIAVFLPMLLIALAALAEVFQSLRLAFSIFTDDADVRWPPEDFPARDMTSEQTDDPLSALPMELPAPDPTPGVNQNE